MGALSAEEGRKAGRADLDLVTSSPFSSRPGCELARAERRPGLVEIELGLEG